MGTYDTVNSRAPEAIAAAASRFDPLLSTANVHLDRNASLASLEPRGRLHLPGVLIEVVAPRPIRTLGRQLAVSASALDGR